MAAPTNKQEFINYCLRKLGEPVIQVNVAVEQAEDRVDEALYRFYERHYTAVEECFIIINLTDEDLQKGYVTLPEDIIGVVDLFKPSVAANVYSVEYAQFIHDLYSVASPYGSSGNLSRFYLTQMNLSLLNYLFNPDYQYDFNLVTHKLIVAGGLRNAKNVAGGIIVKAYRRIQGELSKTSPTNSEVHNIWRVKWLQDYCTALIKRQWATNLGKYNGVQLLGGVTMNGETLWAQAEEEISRLEEQLLNEYEEPVDFLVG